VPIVVSLPKVLFSEQAGPCQKQAGIGLFHAFWAAKPLKFQKILFFL
jgi:hypothetical protein